MSKPDNVEVELELTYLAREIPKEINGVKPSRLLDIYVPENSSAPFIRLRSKDDKCEITKKKPIDKNDFSRQTEQTIPLEKDEFEALAVSSGRRVEKDRYQVIIEGKTAEVDVFDGALKGLVVIDFEFDTPEAKADFTPPACCLAEVTQELFIAGGQLAGKSYTDIAPVLDKFDYKALT